MNHALNASILTFPGVGEKRAEAYAKLGIKTGYALLHHFPRGYQHRGNVKNFAETENGEICALLLTIGTQPKSALLKNRMTLTKFPAFDDTASCTVVFLIRITSATYFMSAICSVSGRKSTGSAIKSS